MKNILIALEFDDKADALLKQAEAIAKRFDSHVWIVHIAAPDPGFVGYEVGPQYVRNARAETLIDERRTLQGYANAFKAKGIEATGLVIQGTTSEAILEEAEKIEAELLMIGYNARSALYKLFIGDTTASVIADTQIPVLVVP